MSTARRRTSARPEARERAIMLIILAGNAFLMALKIAFGFLGGSTALLADGVHSAGDALASAAVLFSINISVRPPDADHPYGHGKIEAIAAGLTALLLAGVSFEVAISAFRAVLGSSHPTPSLSTAAVAVISIAANEAMFRFGNSFGKKVGSRAIIANSWDNRADALSSLTALAGILGARFGYAFLDPVAALVVSAMIARVVYGLLRESAHELMDGMVSDLGSRIVDIAEGVEGVEHAYARVRRIGRGYSVDLKLEMDPEMSVSGSHDVGIEVKNRIARTIKGVSDVMIHVHPHDERE